ncbi:hypothetical protein T484DRAFT_1882857 [Baffinella frigidus]|nr:hypothetical protein T484DRAFT_1882857 [Cryptophyta sp. CCMP2293]
MASLTSRRSDFAKQAVDELLQTTKAHRSLHAYARHHSSHALMAEFVPTKDILRRRASVEGTKTSRPQKPRRSSLPLEDEFMQTTKRELPLLALRIF